MIIVMGPTGSGKSSFISLLSDEHVEVSHSLHSRGCLEKSRVSGTSLIRSIDTISTRPYQTRDRINGKSVFLVDTPGFDDTSRPDAEILKEITFFLMMMHERRVALAGIIYMHRISDPRMSGSATKNLQLFKALCGEQNYQHVVLASTMWSRDEDKKTAERSRLEDLRESFWSDLIQGGSSVKKHRGDTNSALEIVRKLATKDFPPRRPITLAIQQELGAEGKTLANTAAGQLLSQEILRERERMGRELDELRLSLEEAERGDDPDAAESIRNEQHTISDRTAKRVRDAQGLSIRLEQLADEQRPKYQKIIAEILSQGQRDGDERHGSTSSPRSVRHSKTHGSETSAARTRRSKRSVPTTHRDGSKPPHHGVGDSGKKKTSEKKPTTPEHATSLSAIVLMGWIIESRTKLTIASSAAEWRV